MLHERQPLECIIKNFRKFFIKTSRHDKKTLLKFAMVVILFGWYQTSHHKERFKLLKYIVIIHIYVLPHSTTKPVNIKQSETFIDSTGLEQKKKKRLPQGLKLSPEQCKHCHQHLLYAAELSQVLDACSQQDGPNLLLGYPKNQTTPLLPVSKDVQRSIKDEKLNFWIHNSTWYAQWYKYEIHHAETYIMQQKKKKASTGIYRRA